MAVTCVVDMSVEQLHTTIIIPFDDLLLCEMQQYHCERIESLEHDLCTMCLPWMIHVSWHCSAVK